MKNKGFIMIETIVVIAALSIGLVILYTSYALILGRANVKSNYDNINHIYKTFFVLDYLRETQMHTVPAIYETTTPGIDQNLLNMMNTFEIEKVYIVISNYRDLIMTNNLNIYDGSSIAYLRSLKGDWNDEKFHIIVKFSKDHPNLSGIKSVNYASLDYSDNTIETGDVIAKTATHNSIVSSSYQGSYQAPDMIRYLESISVSNGSISNYSISGNTVNYTITGGVPNGTAYKNATPINATQKNVNTYSCPDGGQVSGTNCVADNGLSFVISPVTEKETCEESKLCWKDCSYDIETSNTCYCGNGYSIASINTCGSWSSSSIPCSDEDDDGNSRSRSCKCNCSWNGNYSATLTTNVVYECPTGSNYLDGTTCYQCASGETLTADRRCQYSVYNYTVTIEYYAY